MGRSLPRVSEAGWGPRPCPGVRAGARIPSRGRAAPRRERPPDRRADDLVPRARRPPRPDRGDLRGRAGRDRRVRSRSDALRPRARRALGPRGAPAPVRPRAPAADPRRVRVHRPRLGARPRGAPGRRRHAVEAVRHGAARQARRGGPRAGRAPRARPPMSRLRWTTAGESHGAALVGVLEGLPSGMPLDLARVDAELARRQKGYGRGGRMRIERDAIELLSGTRGGVTLGSPISFAVRNLDATIEKLPVPTNPRPGHADLAGCQKHGHRDPRAVLERASARETAARVAIAAVARQVLERFGI